MFLVTAPIRGRARMSFFLSLHLRSLSLHLSRVFLCLSSCTCLMQDMWVGWGGVGWGVGWDVHVRCVCCSSYWFHRCKCNEHKRTASYRRRHHVFVSFISVLQMVSYDMLWRITWIQLIYPATIRFKSELIMGFQFGTPFYAFFFTGLSAGRLWAAGGHVSGGERSPRARQEWERWIGWVMIKW